MVSRRRKIFSLSQITSFKCTCNSKFVGRGLDVWNSFVRPALQISAIWYDPLILKIMSELVMIDKSWGGQKKFRWKI